MAADDYRLDSARQKALVDQMKCVKQVHVANPLMKSIEWSRDPSEQMIPLTR